ncbi:hypothetical protein [Streptomyces sp. NPDC096132]|uniref:hypothetical protein n=1 Tax=Streptomyces sp. NPDC096132 TaxID=3366075 RepID=UPI00381A21A7
MTTHGRDRRDQAGGSERAEGGGTVERGETVEGGAARARTHLSGAGLRARGWTAAMVRRLLGEPDLLRPNPYVRAAPQIRLYRVERVEAAERGAEFRAVSAALGRRSTAARRAVRRRRRKLLARIAARSLLSGDPGHGAAEEPDT